MTTSNKCNHALEIAEDMYYTFLENQKEGTNWEGLPDDDKAGWRNVAEQALPIIAKHAANDIRVYLDLKASVATGWKKWLYWAGMGIAGAVLGGRWNVSVRLRALRGRNAGPHRGMQRRLLPRH